MRDFLWVIAAVSLFAGCGGNPDNGGDGGPAFDASGTYTLTYERVSRSDTCETRDMDFIAGILVVVHDTNDISLDFGSGFATSGSVNKDGIYTVSGSFDDAGESISFTSVGVLTETDIASDLDVEETHETVGDYDIDADPEPDCRIRGKLSGPKSS